jgi:uncharacterized protein YgiM (DUF1202 family)
MLKRLLPLTLLALILIMIIAGCGGGEDAPAGDPCAEGSIPETIAPIQALMTEFDDITFIANLTPQQSLAESLYRLQDVRRRLEQVPPDSCVLTFRDAGVNYMNSVVTYLAFFMGGATSEQVSGAIASSQNLRILYETEQARLLGEAYTPPPTITPFPPSSDAPAAVATEAPIATAGVTVTNLAVEPVNLRSSPSVDAELVGQLTAGTQAIALAANPARDWLLIDFNGSQVWVFAQLVQVEGTVESLPIQDVATP